MHLELRSKVISKEEKKSIYNCVDSGWPTLGPVHLLFKYLPIFLKTILEVISQMHCELLFIAYKVSYLREHILVSIS